ncbi:death-associated protein-like 1 [Pelodytes ibericus]
MMKEIQTAPLKGGHPPAVKAGGMRVSKKQGNDENGTPEKNLKKPGMEKSSFVFGMSAKMQAMNLLHGALEKLNHEFPADSVNLTHQKPRPTLEKIVLPKRLYIIHQPRRC